MNFNDMFELCYCINLDSRKDRWQKTQFELEILDISPERFKAIEHSMGWMGCSQSHLSILKEARRKKKNVFIFEDDVQIINYEKGILESALNELSDWGWAMFYLGGNPLAPFHQVSDHLAKLNYAHSTHAYGINKDYLDRIISAIELFEGIYPIDVIYAKVIMPVFGCYITVPMLASQRDSYSNVEKKIMTYEIPIARYNQFLIRKPNDPK